MPVAVRPEATIAHQLAGFGYRVVLIEKRRFPRHQIGESLTPSIFPLLDFLGVRDQVEQAGFLRMAGHSVCWGSSRPRTAYYSSDHHRRGFQSVRADFDLILLKHARQAGVRVVEGQPVRDVRPDGEHDVLVRYGSRGRIRAAFCVDATGHAGIYARHNLRQRDSVFQTLALTGYWQNAGNPPGVDFANTLLEAYADGMVWSVPLHTGERNVTLLVDWRHSRAIKRVGLQRFYIEELRKAAYVSGFLADAHLPHPPQVFDASLYTARQFVAGRTLLVGDAGLFIDPLSSEGVPESHGVRHYRRCGCQHHTSAARHAVPGCRAVRSRSAGTPITATISNRPVITRKRAAGRTVPFGSIVACALSPTQVPSLRSSRLRPFRHLIPSRFRT